MRCGRPTKAGTPCTRKAARGESTCAQHRPSPSVPVLKLTPEAHKTICQALASGVYRKDAAQYAGIGVSTFYRWMETGEADTEAGVESPQATLWKGVIEAEAKAKTRLSALIVKAAVEDWRAAAWILERKHPDEYGRRDRVEITNPPPPTMDMTVLDDDDLDELERLANKAGPGAADA